MKRTMFRALVLGCCLMAAGLVSDTLFDTRFVIREAEAERICYAKRYERSVDRANT